MTRPTRRERPIIFGAESVRAILAGRKTQTRRVLRHEHIDELAAFAWDEERGLWESAIAGDYGALGHGDWHRCPLGKPGDRLWVRETWAHDAGGGGDCDDPRCGISGHVWYRASEDSRTAETFAGSARWRSPILMPRWASRLTLEVSAVRVQRLQEITEEDCVAEGAETWCACPCHGEGGQPAIGTCEDCALRHGRDWFRDGWNAINAKRGAWDANPWVWAITFRRVA